MSSRSKSSRKGSDAMEAEVSSSTSSSSDVVEEKKKKKKSKLISEENHVDSTSSESMEVESTKKSKKDKKRSAESDSSSSSSVCEEPSKKKQKKERNEKPELVETNDTEVVVETENLKKDKKKSKKNKEESDSMNGKEEKSQNGLATPSKAKFQLTVPNTSSSSASSSAPSSPSSPSSPSEDPSRPPLSAFDISPDIINKLSSSGITRLFPIQAQTYPIIFAGGDVLGRASTGSGKTLAFSLPICEKINRENIKLVSGRLPKVIVLTPTRELAKQVSETFQLVGGKLTVTTVYGGTPYDSQISQLRRGVDIVVGTCGRIKDLLEGGSLKLNNINYIILDEADEMLNMGFADDVELILKQVPRGNLNVQTLLFSATIPGWVHNLAKKYLKSDHKSIDLVGENSAKTNSDIRHLSLPCHWTERNSVLADVIRVYGGGSNGKPRTIVFCETKKDANEVAISSSVASECQVMHGDISQQQRETTLKSFKEKKFSVLVCTDVAARGIDIPGVELVVQLEPPEKTETYVHRSGRTGRAGAKGTSLVFYTPKQHFYLQNIERSAKLKFQRVGVPHAQELISHSIQTAVKELNKVSEKVLPMFTPAAQQMLQDNQNDALPLLAACLAKITGYTEPMKKRSLLCSQVGWVTIEMKYSGEIRALGFVWGIIKQHLFSDAQAEDYVKGIRITADRHGAVFDVPAEQEELVKSKAEELQDARLSFAVATTLPELEQMESSRPERSSFGGGRWSGGGRGRGSFGGGGDRRMSFGRGGRGGRGGFRR